MTLTKLRDDCRDRVRVSDRVRVRDRVRSGVRGRVRVRVRFRVSFWVSSRSHITSHESCYSDTPPPVTDSTQLSAQHVSTALCCMSALFVGSLGKITYILPVHLQQVRSCKHLQSCSATPSSKVNNQHMDVEVWSCRCYINLFTNYSVVYLCIAYASYMILAILFNERYL